MRRAPITVVGVGANGCASLTSRAAGAIARADVLVGGERQLGFFPDFRGERIALKGGLRDALDRVEELAGEAAVCILASGDPLFFGIGALIVRRFGAADVEILPRPSSVQLAFARAGLSWSDARFVSTHGRSIEGLVARLRRHRKVACLTDAESSPGRIAAHMIEHGERDWRAWVCEELGGPGERVRAFALEELADRSDIGPLNVLLLARTDTAWRPPPALPYLPEEQFARAMPRKGLITKREVRALSLASLGLRRDSVIWDVGAGSGSVAIEAALLAPDGRAYAIENVPERVAMCRDNAREHGADNLRVIGGLAPEALADLEAPDAVFVGGTRGSMDAIVAATLERLRPGGRLVVNAVTLDSVAAAHAAFASRQITPEVTMLQIARGRELAGYLRYEAQNPIHIFAATRPPGEEDHA